METSGRYLSNTLSIIACISSAYGNRWTGGVFYLAIGMVCDKRGEPVAAKENSEDPD